jgi:DNA-directed RNA polymerase specialized sigma24 family protein
MRYSVALVCCLAICSVAIPAAQYSEEETVYRSYLAAFKALKSFDDRSFETYLSASAQRKLADARAQRAGRVCDPCPSPEQELEMAKRCGRILDQIFAPSDVSPEVSCR